MDKQTYLQQIEKEKEELKITKPNEELWVCKECGSLDIEEKYWVNINNDKIESETDDLEYYCNNCNCKHEYPTLTVNNFQLNLT